MILAYDLDGTLANTEPLIRQCYEAAGVTPPPDFFGKSFEEWSDDEEAHKRKNKIYLEALKTYDLKETNITKMARDYGGMVLTSASGEAALAVLEKLRLDRILRVYASLSVLDKAQIMNRYAYGVMFEDSLQTAQKLKELTTWTICHVL